MKWLLTYYKEYKTAVALVKAINPSIKLKSYFQSLMYTSLLIVPIILLTVNLMIFAQIQLLLSYVILILLIFGVFIHLTLYYGAIKYFEKGFECAKIRMLQIVYGLSTSIIIFVLGYFVIRNFFGGYV